MWKGEDMNTLWRSCIAFAALACVAGSSSVTAQDGKGYAQVTQGAYSIVAEVRAKPGKEAELIESFLAAGKHIALVCHAPGVLRHVKTPKGEPLVAGKTVTASPMARKRRWD
jgi:hypothetical protein